MLTAPVRFDSKKCDVIDLFVIKIFGKKPTIGKG